jgi:hypothetical protein
MDIFILMVAPIMLFLAVGAFQYNKISKQLVETKRFRYRGSPEKQTNLVVVYALAAIISCLVLFGLDHSNKAELFTDIEVWNGRVNSKDRLHGQYSESYDCNCRTKKRRVSYTTTVGSGKNARSETRYRTETYTECDTCYRQWYTVKWVCNTTFGSIAIADTKALSPTVYNVSDPERYTKIVIGDPASITKPYTNYVQGSEFSILKRRQQQIPTDVKIAAYPTAIYDIYKLDRFITDVDMSVEDKKKWNTMVSELNRDVAGKKQANIVVYVTKYGSNFADMLEAKWDGVNKNDIVLVIGMSENKIGWSKVISWTKREDFKIHVRDRVNALPVLDSSAVSAILSQEVADKFERRQMKDFQYLENEVSVSTTGIIFWIVLNVLMCVGCWFFVKKS